MRRNAFALLSIAIVISSTRARAQPDPVPVPEPVPEPAPPPQPQPQPQPPPQPEPEPAPTTTDIKQAPPSPSGPTPVGATPPVQTGPIVIDQRPPLGFLTTKEDLLIDPRMARSWGVAPARWFAASTVDVGFVYARPRLSLGYGKPFTTWAGIDINPVASGNGLGAYGGLRLEVPFLDLRVGTRYFRAFTHTYLDPQEKFSRLVLETEADAPASIFTHEAEADLSIPVGPGNLLGRGSVSYIMGVPQGKMVLEETLRVIARPPLIWRGRGGYAFRLGQYSQHSIGFVVDVMAVPNRDDSLTIRAGPILRVVLSRRVDVRGSFVLTAISPDDIGLAGSDFTELGVRYRWATEP
jgi:hypothetical protein